MKKLSKLMFFAVLFVVPAECFENLSLLSEYAGQPVQSESYRYPAIYTADKAVDGFLQRDVGEDTCSITLANTHILSAWWKHSLKRMANVAFLKIFFRNSTVNRHTGFSVFVFNDSSFIPPSNSGEIVYNNDPSVCPTEEMMIKVNKVTQGLALYNSKDSPLDTNCTGYEPTFATIEICEVLVIGCPLQHYGGKCTPCYQRCHDKHCDAFSGSCIYGCNNTYMTSLDCSCIPGHYGNFCEDVCGKCITGTYCDQYAGVCPKGCSENWQGAKCDECQDYKYGPNCVFDCGHCKNNTTCSKTDGRCSYGCESGWSGSFCLELPPFTAKADAGDWFLKTPSIITLVGSSLFVVAILSIGIRVLYKKIKQNDMKEIKEECSGKSDSNKDSMRYICGQNDVTGDNHYYNDMNSKQIDFYANDTILYENV
ncbi:delta-like protein D [Saccostrea cucullata]|uniref:delta-like protein D n=1 Tax=Saccostrea cuccullata TaxID=36930 RepID=UPI002ED5B52D